MYSPKLLTKRRLFLWFSTFLQLFNFLASSLSDSSESFVIPPPSTKVSLSGWKKIKSTVLITNQLFFRNLVKLQHVKVMYIIYLIFSWNYSRKNEHHLFFKKSREIAACIKNDIIQFKNIIKLLSLSDCKIRAKFYLTSHFSEISRNCSL